MTVPADTRSWEQAYTGTLRPKHGKERITDCASLRKLNAIFGVLILALSLVVP